MQQDESSDYLEWLQLANDPSQTEETRRHYRARMEDFIRARMLSAFRLTSEASDTLR
jgi:hypothetical protein